MKTDDPAFRHIWKMMAADLALLLAEWLVPLTVFIIVLYGDEAVSRTVMIESDLDLYLLWTIRCLRLLTWLGMIVHLERLEGGFRSAKRWYLLRIFVFLTVQVLSGIQSQSPLLVGVGNRSLFSIITVVFSTLIIPPLLPMGNRALLKAGADLLRYYGMEKPARANSRCGKLLAVFSWTLDGCMLLFDSFAIVVFLTSEYTLLPYLVAPDSSELIQWGLVIVFPLIVLSALGVLILWGISAGRMKKTHRLLKGISE
ncbi:MAG: hypothetical protein IKO52_15035 [Clostridia bacterium]|nr:hypothetical protein [Clostridia bacterium]